MMRGVFLLFASAAAVQAQSPKPAADPAALECRDYASKLEICAPYTCTFTHPMTGAILERKVVGPAGNACATVEAMPGKHTMRCEFPADVRKSVAAFYRQMLAAETRGKTIGGKLAVDDRGKGTSTTAVDGKPVVNPLQQALERGICKIAE